MIKAGLIAAAAGILAVSTLAAPSPARADSVSVGIAIGDGGALTFGFDGGLQDAGWDPAGSGREDREPVWQRYRRDHDDWRRHEWRDDDWERPRWRERHWQRVQVCEPVVRIKRVYDYWGNLRVVRTYDEECRWIRR